MSATVFRSLRAGPGTWKYTDVTAFSIYSGGYGVSYPGAVGVGAVSLDIWESCRIDVWDRL